MRPRSYARKPTDAHTSSRTHPRAHTYIRPCTHVYALIRAREGNFLTANLLYTLSNRIQSSIRHHSLLLSNHCTIHIHIGTPLAAASVQTTVICQHLTSIIIHSEPLSNYPPTINHPFNHLFSQLSYIITTDHHLKQSIHTSYPFLSDFHSNSPSYQYVSML